MAHAPQKDYSREKIRNVAFIGHGGSGKTTLCECLLFNTKTINRIGKIAEGATISDYHPDEIERRISINTSFLHGEWQEHKLNVLDTPGYTDFTGEVLGALRVSDIAVVVLKAVEGTEVGTEIVWNYTKSGHIPSLFVVNKLDNENSDFDHAIATAR
ncbi:MAG TPA: GTP-binding protein, partial [Bacteroidota bacterium]